MSKKQCTRLLFPAAIVALCGLLVAFAIHADAGLMVFRDRTSYVAARGGGFGAYNFNSFSADTSFQSSAINFGSFTLSKFGPATSGNLVDVAPFVDGNTVNGTPYANLFVDDDTNVTISFPTPLTAWGGDFRGSTAFNFGVSLVGRRGLASIGGPQSADTGFVGFVTDDGDALNGVVLRYDGPGGGNANPLLDDVEFATSSAVPEPTTLVLLGVAGAFMGVFASRRMRQRSSADEPNREGA
jgi:hypothetical protein